MDARESLDITYEWLDGDRLAILDPIFFANNWTPLNHLTSRALVARTESGTIAGFHVIQLFPHAEPLWVSPEFRNHGVADFLIDCVVAFLNSVNARGFMVIADTPSVAKRCESIGMRRVDSPVYIA